MKDNFNKLEPSLEAPTQIKENVDGSLQSLRLMGEMTNLYVGNFAEVFLMLVDQASGSTQKIEK